MAKVLVVEDEEYELIRYEKTLTDEGYEVILARDGYEALEKFKTEKPDCVVLDIKLPGIDGIETLGKIVREKENIPIILHTSHSVWRENFRTRLAAAYILKSKNMTELKEKLRELLISAGKLNS